MTSMKHTPQHSGVRVYEFNSVTLSLHLFWERPDLVIRFSLPVVSTCNRLTYGIGRQSVTCEDFNTQYGRRKAFCEYKQSMLKSFGSAWVYDSYVNPVLNAVNFTADAGGYAGGIMLLSTIEHFLLLRNKPRPKSIV